MLMPRVRPGLCSQQSAFSVVVGVPPDGQFFQDKKGQHTRQQHGKHFMGRESRTQGLGQQVQHGGGQEHSGRKADRIGQHLLGKASQNQKSRQQTEQAAQQTGQQDVQDQWHSELFLMNGAGH